MAEPGSRTRLAGAVLRGREAREERICRMGYSIGRHCDDVRKLAVSRRRGEGEGGAFRNSGRLESKQGRDI